MGLLVAVVLVSQVRSAEEGRDPEAVRQAYTAVASRLDQGGDLMIVANIDGLLERFMADLVEIASTASGDDAESKQAMETATKLHAFLKKSGFYAVNGVGMSSVPRADGLNVVKTFVSRDSEAAVLPLWRACVGGAPRELQSMRFMPTDTEMARAGTADIKQLWSLMKSAISEVAPPEAAAQFEQSIAAAGDVAEEGGVGQYIRGGTIPACPKAGVYMLNPIGQDPTCSTAGHKLP
jgi:hypothetical protein